MNAKAIKYALSSYYLWRRSMLYFATEMSINGYLADTIAIDKKLFIIETEIKIGRSDLVCELRSIRNSLGLEFYGAMSKGSMSKHSKHLNYIRKYKNLSTAWGNIPHKFYFAVLDFLIPICQEYLIDTPHGIIGIYPNQIRTLNYGITVVKRAKFLHKEPLNNEVIAKLFRKLSTENHFLR